MHAAPLNAVKIMYIFQLIAHNSGGTAKARIMFQNQFAAVARETALARTLLGKISAGYAHDVGPQVVANVATKRYEAATMPFDTDGLSFTIQVTSLLPVPSFGWPYTA